MQCLSLTSCSGLTGDVGTLVLPEGMRGLHVVECTGLTGKVPQLQAAVSEDKDGDAVKRKSQGVLLGTGGTAKREGGPEARAFADDRLLHDLGLQRPFGEGIHRCIELTRLESNVVAEEFLELWGAYLVRTSQVRPRDHLHWKKIWPRLCLPDDDIAHFNFYLRYSALPDNEIEAWKAEKLDHHVRALATVGPPSVNGVKFRENAKTRERYDERVSISRPVTNHRLRSLLTFPPPPSTVHSPSNRAAHIRGAKAAQSLGRDWLRRKIDFLEAKAQARKAENEADYAAKKAKSDAAAAQCARAAAAADAAADAAAAAERARVVAVAAEWEAYLERTVPTVRADLKGSPPFRDFCQIALMYAAANNNLEIGDGCWRWEGPNKSLSRCVQELIRVGAALDVQDKCGDTALMKAASTNHLEIVQELIRSEYPEANIQAFADDGAREQQVGGHRAGAARDSQRYRKELEGLITPSILACTFTQLDQIGGIVQS